MKPVIKKVALAALATVILPIAAIPAPAPRPASGSPDPAPDPAAGAKLAALISIRPVGIAIRPADVATDARRVPAKASRTRGSRTSASGAGQPTIASWYDERPAACWDRLGRHAFPKGLRVWTAHKTLPCGTAIVVSGAAGTLRVWVYDRGPYVRGRGLDLSAAAFRGVCGSTGRGLCRVTWRMA
ncbi:MAG TPA: septal ring lytic transglycosylase RlpA family protein [Actinomycetota bacterium]